MKGFKYKWLRDKNGYAVRMTRPRSYLHREIADVNPIRFLNGQPLDCRKKNLSLKRIANNICGHLSFPHHAFGLCKNCYTEQAFGKAICHSNRLSYVRYGPFKGLCRSCYFTRRGLKSRYNLSDQDYEVMYNFQGGVCAICKTPTKDRLSVDHCHASGRIRGLLCGNCNRSIGLMKDDVNRFVNAVAYLTSD